LVGSEAALLMLATVSGKHFETSSKIKTMNLKTFKLGFYTLMIIHVLGCNNSLKSNENDSIDSTNLKKLVQEWNSAHETKDIGKYSILLDDSVLFYGMLQDKNTCIESKLSLFKKNPDFYQQIFGDIQVTKIDSSNFKCSFIKRVTVNQATKDYPSYLTFRKVKNQWKIFVESDLVTDKNLSQNKSLRTITKNTIKGDFNGDGKLDYMWLEAPKINETDMECIGECISYIKFSDPNIPSIKVESCIGGEPINHGDLNQNGTDEIGLLPSWFTSCWRSYFVWTLLDDKWVNAVEPFSTHCNQWEEGINPIEKDITNEGYAIIRFSGFSDEEGILIKSKSVRIAK